MNGSRFIHIGPDIIVPAISPEAKDLLETIMERWKEHEARLTALNPAYEPTIYGFAYWLCRWSDLVQPNTESEGTPS